MTVLLNPAGGGSSSIYVPPTAGSGDPTTAFDSSQGYYKNATYFNATSETAWICKDATVGAAKWQKLSNSLFPGYRGGGVWYDLFDDQSRLAGVAAFNTDLYLFPFLIKEKVTLTDLGIGITTLSAVGSGGDVAMVAIYAHDQTVGRPTGAPLASVQGIATTATGGASVAIGSDLALDPGLYWGASQANNSTVRCLSVAQVSQADIATRIGSATIGNVGRLASIALVVSANTYGTFPNLTSATFTENNGSGRLARILGKTK